MISNDIIKATLAKAGQFDHLTVEGDGYHYHITVVADFFDNMSKIKRQQWIYEILNDFILSGALHAITIKAYTPSEWSKIHG